MNRQFYYLIGMSVALLFIFSCKHPYGELSDTATQVGDTTTPCDATKIYFQQQVLPILVSNCAMSGCHDDATHKEGIVLTSYSKVISTGGVGAGNPGNSKLYEVLVTTSSDDRMPRPPQSPLSSQQIQIIYNWIQQGAQNLVCENMCDSSLFTYNGAIRPLIQNKCQGCHSGTNAQGGIDISTYTLLKAKVTDGKLWGSINQLPGFSAMPKNGAKLSDCEITQFQKWIAAGSPNN